MSSKINIWSIIVGHIGTLKDSSNGKVSFADYGTFYGLPIASALGLLSFGVVITADANSLLVNFGAIFTALLLSVLVLVYDQGEKLNSTTDIKQKHQMDLKKNLLEQLYFNICYAIVVSVALVFLCLLYTFLPNRAIPFSLAHFSVSLDIKLYIASPLILIFVINLLLTILMVVKRMHTLLTIKM